MSLKLGNQGDKATNSNKMRVYVHIVAPTIGDKMEHLGELQWVRTVVDLDDR
jgi:hypothetical protein